LLGHLIGTPLSAQQLNEAGLGSGLIWAVFRTSGTFEFSEDDFSAAYDGWLKAALAKSALQRVVAPLWGIDFKGRIDLGDGAELGQLSDDEVSACLQMGLISTPFVGSGFASVESRAAIRINLTLPRGLHDAFSEDDKRAATEVGTAAWNFAHEVLDALRVFRAGRFALAGPISINEDFSSWQVSGERGGVPFLFGTEFVLRDEEARNFAEWLPIYRRARKHGAVDAVVRRFSYAGDRARKDDEIVDLVAALEALLLSELQDRGELRFRTALRGAVFIEAQELTQRQVQAQLRRAYDVRSAVAHGGTPSAKHLRSAAGDELTLAEFVDSVAELVRLAVRRAVDVVGAGGQWPPDWDGLVLEDATYP
jgi:hypothetical protein